MPTYTYICENCGKETEAFQKITDDPLSVCPHCGGKLNKKISGGVGLVFKGSGFYITDYKNKNNNSTTEKSKKEVKKTRLTLWRTMRLIGACKFFCYTGT